MSSEVMSSPVVSSPGWTVSSRIWDWGSFATEYPLELTQVLAFAMSDWIPTITNLNPSVDEAHKVLPVGAFQSMLKLI